MKIMIVDDHADMRRILRSIAFPHTGGTEAIIECEDGAEAVEQFSLHYPDVVLMDIQLKTMNGFDAAEKIFQQEPNAKVVFVTSFATQAFRSRAEKLRAYGFISKENLSELDLLFQNLSLKGGTP
ncbi:MAG: response regulator transcription factor [Bacteroidota bacterium]|nr:response regulator transcription factor [Bacteroidota bacterium]